MTPPRAAARRHRRGCALAAVLMSAALAAAAPPVRASEVAADDGVWPLDPEPAVVSHFAPPTHSWGAGHRGVDLAGAPGQVVRSTMAGTVGFVGSVAGKPVVTVLHGDRRTTYEPVSGSVEPGDDVAAGEPIGRLVLAASHCFPAACLHWGLRRGEEYLDPLSLLGGGPVRLLPLWRDDPVAPGADSDPWKPVLTLWHPWIDLLLRRADEPAGRPDGGGRW